MKKHPLPAIVSPISPDLRRYLDRVRDFLDDPDGFVTKKELVSTGIFTKTGSGVIGYIDPSDATTCVSPPAPLSLAASGAMTSVVLSWKGVNYSSCYSHTEIYRAATDDLGVATLIGTTTSGIFTDAVGSDSVKYYWVRFVNIKSDSGPYNATAGVKGETSPDLEYVLDQLSEAYGIGTAAPFFEVPGPPAAAIVINGATIAPGLYMYSAFIHDAAITNAKIKNLAVDHAKIALLAVEEANIADLAVTNAKINDLDAGKIKAGYISAKRIDANTITGDHIDSNTIKANNLVIQSVAQAVDATWDNQFNHDVRIVVSPGSGTTPPVVDGSWFMSSEAYAVWSPYSQTTTELTPNTWGAVNTIGFYRKELDGTDNNVTQADLQSRTDVHATSTLSVVGATTTSVSVVSTSGFPEAGTISIRNGTTIFVYTSKTGTTFDGVSQSTNAVGASEPVTLVTTWYLQVYKDTGTWAKYRVLASRRDTTYSSGNPLYVDAITCRVELVSHRGVPTSISGGTNNFTHTVRTDRTLDPVLLQVSRYSADDPATIINRGTTTIDGGSITANSIDVDRIDAASLDAHIITVSPPGGGAEAWTTATAYDVDDQVFVDGNIYNCVTAHTSGTDTNKPPGDKWNAVVGSASPSANERLVILNDRISIFNGGVERVRLGDLN